ncbi:MAG: hypothetical protein HY698_00125, partial [Deltaproteobacteria bacterium]|nr:hypothetical protein [Deltaproteobacteria bacterium]
MKPSTRHALVATLLFTSCGGQSATRPTAVASPAPREIPALKPPAVMPANIMAPEAAPPPAPSPLVATYRETAQRIFAAARSDQDAWKKLEYLTDRIGPRLSGSVALDRAIAWAMATMAADGHEVRKEKVMVPNWVRGEESAEIVLPIQRGLRVLGLGGTVGTAKKGIVAEIVVVSTFEELEALGDKARGRI